MGNFTSSLVTVKTSIVLMSFKNFNLFYIISVHDCEVFYFLANLWATLLVGQGLRFMSLALNWQIFRFGICELMSLQDALYFVGDNAVHFYEQIFDNIRKLIGDFSCISSKLLVGQSSGFRV